MGSIFDEHGDAALRRFLADCARVIDVDEERAFGLAKAALAYYSGTAAMRDRLRPLQDIEARWYRSLSAGRPDFAVYDDPYMVSDIWASWILYSRKYLLALRKPALPDGRSIGQMIGPARAVADVGCGFGYTTAGLKELWPAADVFGTQLPGSEQFKIATDVGARRGFTVVPAVEHIGQQLDVVFASEYFEHIEDPFNDVARMVHAGRPRAFVIANSFNTKSVGHFVAYRHRDEVIPQAAVSRRFNRYLKDLGYTMVKTKLWNNRPAIWMRD